MFITKGHFLSPYTRVMKNGKSISLIQSVDTDLMVCIRIVGFDEVDETPILDLIKIDKVAFITEGMPGHLLDLLPDDIEKYDTEEDFKGL